jgi:hypothetical protein
VSKLRAHLKKNLNLPHEEARRNLRTQAKFRSLPVSPNALQLTKKAPVACLIPPNLKHGKSSRNQHVRINSEFVGEKSGKEAVVSFKKSEISYKI